MELMQAIRERRSVRQFLDKPVEKDKIQRILEAAHSAPSASNYKFWYFIVVQNQKKKNYFRNAFMTKL